MKAHVHDRPPGRRRAQRGEPPQRRDRDFIATASHELRTSLGALQATLELLREEALRGRADPDQTVGYLEMALGQTRSLTRLTTDLLDITRLDAEVPLALEPVDVRELARATRDEVAARLEADDRRATVDGGPAVALAGRAAVGRILRILLDNAAAYGDGTVTVTVSHDDDSILVTVADEGAGIAPDERELVFDRFARGRSAAGAPNGAGLGLAIARGLAQAMGGDVDVAPARGGAQFRLTLRAGPEP